MISRNLPSKTKKLQDDRFLRQIVDLPGGQVSASQERMSPVLFGFGSLHLTVSEADIFGVTRRAFAKHPTL